MGIGGLADGYAQLLPRLYLVGRRNDAVGGAYYTEVPHRFARRECGVPGGDGGQLFAQLFQRTTGRALEEGLEGGAIGTHPAQELVEGDIGQPVQGSLENGGRDAAGLVDGEGGAVDGYPPADGKRGAGHDAGGRPDAHRPAYHPDVGVFRQERGVEVEGPVVVAEHVVAIGGTVCLERGFIGSPARKEEEETRMMFVYQVYLFHGVFVLKGSGLFGDAGDEPEDFVCADIGRQGEADAGGAFGDRRRTHGQGIEAVALQLVRTEDGVGARTHHQRHDVAGAGTGVRPCRQGIAQQAADVCQVFAPFLHVGQLAHDEQGPGDVDGGQGGGEDESTHPVDEVVAYHLAADDVGSGGSGGFSEGSYQEIDVADATGFFGATQSLRATYAEGVGFVDVEQEVVVPFLQGYQCAQVGFIAVHAEDALGDEDNPAVCPVMLFDEPAGLGEVVVPVTDAPGCREADAVNQAGMYELVGQDEGLGIADGG